MGAHVVYIAHMSPMTRVNLVLDAETLNVLSKLEMMTGKSRSEVVRTAVAVYFEQEGAGLKQAALARLLDDGGKPKKPAKSRK